MCMLYAFSANRKFNINKHLKSFFSYSTFHPHGWGIAAYKADNDLRLAKDKGAAYRSKQVKELLKKDIPTKLCLAHIRYATIGEITYSNAHPFTADIMGEKWAFAHNGSVSNHEFDIYINPNGETDSERVFCYIQDKLIQARAVNLEEKISVLEDCIEKLSKDSKLNLVISDGTYLYIHCNYKNSLYSYMSDNYVTVCTKALKGSNIALWEPVELNRLIVFENEKKIYEGRNHNNEFFKRNHYAG